MSTNLNIKVIIKTTDKKNLIKKFNCLYTVLILSIQSVTKMDKQTETIRDLRSNKEENVPSTWVCRY